MLHGNPATCNVVAVHRDTGRMGRVVGDTDGGKTGIEQRMGERIVVSTADQERTVRGTVENVALKRLPVGIVGGV